MRLPALEVRPAAWLTSVAKVGPVPGGPARPGSSSRSPRRFAFLRQRGIPYGCDTALLPRQMQLCCAGYGLIPARRVAYGAVQQRMQMKALLLLVLANYPRPVSSDV